MLRLKEAVGWNQTETDLRRNLQLEPGGCFAIDCDGRLASTATVIGYGQRLAWIGMVMTWPEFRGHGFARRLMHHAVEYIDSRRIACAMLDAAPMGEPLYRELGFEAVAPIERWGLQREPGTQTRPQCSEPDFSLDREVFGADRMPLLHSLREHWREDLGSGQYAMGRPGSDASYFGPMLAIDAMSARRGLDAFLSQSGDGGVYWDLFPDHAEAVDLAHDCGFRPLRRLLRMRRGAAVEADYRRMWAIAGFEYG